MEIDGPIWPERCGHGGYVGSYKAIYQNGQTKKVITEEIDIYIFTNGARQEVCLRYGANDSEYYSPVDISQLIANAYQDEIYSRAIEVLDKYGQTIWVKK